MMHMHALDLQPLEMRNEHSVRGRREAVQALSRPVGQHTPREFNWQIHAISPRLSLSVDINTVFTAC